MAHLTHLCQLGQVERERESKRELGSTTVPKEKVRLFSSWFCISLYCSRTNVYFTPVAHRRPHTLCIKIVTSTTNIYFKLLNIIVHTLCTKIVIWERVSITNVYFTPVIHNYTYSFCVEIMTLMSSVYFIQTVAYNCTNTLHWNRNLIVRVWLCAISECA